MDRRITVLGLGAPVLVALAACTTFDTTSHRPPTSSLYLDDDLAPVLVERPYLDRYACRGGTPLVCTCTSLVLGSCRCSC
jgi:hypothetical protein